MSFFCAGSSNEVKKRLKQSSKPTPSSKYGNGNVGVVSSNGRIVNPFQNSTNSNSQSNTKQTVPQVISIPHSNSDLPSGRKMIVLQEYQPGAGDTKGIFVRRGETVMVISQDQNLAHIRNERNKEGYVPSTYLVAPYSTMRSRAKYSAGGPLRHVASGSNIEGMDPPRSSGSPHVIPMYQSKSGGKPRNYSTPDSNRQRSNTSSCTSRRVRSPQDLSYGQGSAVQGQNSANSTYDQKYSPSTSNGVASLTGTSSPVLQSDGSNHSSLCSIEEERGRMLAAEGAPVQNGINDNGRESSRIRGRATSETNISYTKHNVSHLPQSSDQLPRPLPEILRPLSDHQQEDSVFYNSVNDDVPPPLPPRTLYNPPPPQSTSEGDLYIPPSEESPSSLDESNPYAAPADAIPRMQSPHLVGQPRGRYNEMKVRDVTSSQDNGVYSEVFQGNQRPYRHLNDNHVSPNRGGDDPEYLCRLSDGGSFRSRSSRQSGSCVSSLHNQMPEPYCTSHEIIVSHEADVTLTGGGEGKDYIPYISNPPESANSVTHSSSAQIRTFRKNLWGLYIVMDKFQSCDENEVSVQEGDHISVWNQDDPEWYWIVKHDTNEEGFVPSACLKEIVSDNLSEANQGSTEITQSQQFSEQPLPSNSKPPPLPPKESQRYPKPPHPPKSNPSTYDNHTLNRFRERATSHIVRSSPVTTRHTNGTNGTGHRRRLNSDGSLQLSISPPNTPPPPYTKYDQNQAHCHRTHHAFHSNQQTTPPPPSPHNSSAATSRHYSLSQHADVPHSNFSTHMQRTRSHGHAPYRRVRIPLNNETDGGGVENEEEGGERVISPPEAFIEVDGGTLV